LEEEEQAVRAKLIGTSLFLSKHLQNKGKKKKEKVLSRELASNDFVLGNQVGYKLVFIVKLQ
jgi:hypothetical protein